MPTIIEVKKNAALPRARQVLVDESGVGQRLDNFLLRQLKGVPKTHVYRIIRSGEVRLNRGRASADDRLALGDLVRLPPLRMAERVQPLVQGREFPVLFEDEYLLAIDKPAGVAVHGGSGLDFGVIEQLRRARPGSPFLELVHRLDRETSGILLIAKRRRALTRLQQQFRDRSIDKTYLALVHGLWPLRKKVIDLPLQKTLRETTHGSTERRVRVVAPDDPNGQRAISLVRRVQHWPRTGTDAQAPLACSLLEVCIKTGRTHQIRVHLAASGHPIWGDEKYGQFELNKALQKQGLRRMFLHAWQLQFLHPVSQQSVQITAALPPELEFFLERL